MLRNVKNYCGLISAALSIENSECFYEDPYWCLKPFFYFLRMQMPWCLNAGRVRTLSCLIFSTLWQAVFLDCRIFTAWEQPFPELVEAKWILRPSVCAEKQNILKKGISALNSSRYSISPFFSPRLTLSLFYTDIRNGTWPEGKRGINSDPDQTYYLLGRKIYGHGVEQSWNLSDYQLEFYCGFVNSGVTPYGLVDPNGNFYSAQMADLNENPMGHRFGIYLDDTDHTRDPRIGYRFQWER